MKEGQVLYVFLSREMTLTVTEGGRVDPLRKEGRLTWSEVEGFQRSSGGPSSSRKEVQENRERHRL